LVSVLTDEADALRCFRAEERKEEKLENDGWWKLSMRKREVVSGVQAAREGSWDLQAHPSTLLPSRSLLDLDQAVGLSPCADRELELGQKSEKNNLSSNQHWRASLSLDFRTAPPSAEREEQFTRTRPSRVQTH
jgi:hypothetical protein